ncbi:MAG: PorP/SprF family type IX secretion system membrane protein [Prevotellaceae bacterium]|jgi:type IX secretion system PorP/SprF family membrane protein|nr:PorP/SprF family type IX secretion system membrane protein [Prevotellaceae bacterium]
MRQLFLTIAILISGISAVNAQSDFELSQRWFNEAIYNPAATGNSYSMGVFMHARRQWFGIDRAPKTGVISADMFIPAIRSAVGFNVSADKIGFTSAYSARLAYAHYIPINSKSSLSLGFSATLLCWDFNITDASIVDPSDPLLTIGKRTDYNPDFDFGVEYLGPVKVGVSVRHLFKVSSTDYHPGYSRNLWAYASTRLNALSKISVEPTLSYTFHDRVSRYEAGAIFYFGKTDPKHKLNDRFWLGGMYRFNSQLAVLAGMHVTPRIRLGYSFDYSLGDARHLSKVGTHEIFVSWHLNRAFYKNFELCPAYKSYKR